MEIDRNKTYAVISGDIIGSSKLLPDDRAELLNVMKQASIELRTLLPESVPLNVDIFAGDSWQFLVSEPGDSLRAALFYRASIMVATEKKVDTRLVVALGKVDFVPSDRTSEGDGEAFRLSGRALKESAGKQQMRFTNAASGNSDQWNATFGLMDVLVKRWSTKQARAILGVLQGWSHGDIAMRCTPPVERGSVTRLLATAGWHAIEQVIEVFTTEFNYHNGL